MAEAARHSPPDLTDQEVDEICGGLKQNAAKVRFLEGLGVRVLRKPNGRPLVNREHYLIVRFGEKMDQPAANDVGAAPRWRNC